MIDARGPAERLLQFIVDHWAANGWPLPTDANGDIVAYLAAGDPNAVAEDGPALVVTLAQLAPGPSAPRQGLQARGTGAGQMPSATYVVRLMRCTPTWDEGAPSPATIEASGRQLLDDPGRLLDALISWCQNEPLSKSHNGTREVGTVRPEGPSGGLVGHSAQIVISPVQ